MLVLHQLALSKRARPAQHGSAWHDVDMLLAMFKLIAPSRTGTMQTWLQVAV